jgi:S1-C subfamily serine protease
MALFASPVSASADTKAGIKPGSFFYFFDTTFEKVNLFFTFNPENKAQKNLEYADERLAEAEAVAEEKNTDAVKTAVAGYESSIALAAEESSQIKDKGKTEGLLNSIADNISKHQEILAEVYNKVPDEAKEAITKAIEVSKRGQEEAMRQVAELKGEVEKLKQEVAELKKGKGQVSEIEKLRGEIEDLKKKTNTQIVAQPKPATQSVTMGVKLSNSQIITKIKPTTVYITTESGSGSGMIFTADGYILTNDHVVKGVSVAKISLSTGEVINGTVIGRDEVIDLAVIKLNTTKQLPKIDFGDSDKTQQGDEVFTFGFPFGIEGDVSFKEGTISRRIENYFETSAEIHPGNSGGPLVNRYGQVIGINTAIFGKSISGIQLGETIKLAIPINNAKNLIPDLKAGKVFINEAARAKEAEEKRKIEETKKEAERVAAEARAKEAEEKRRIEEENKRIEAQILVAQQCVQSKKAILAEYNTKKLNLERQIADRKAKYYTDYDALTESFRGRGVTASGVQGQYDALLREANKDIELWNLELEKLYVEYSSKLNQFQC